VLWHCAAFIEIMKTIATKNRLLIQRILHKVISQTLIE